MKYIFEIGNILFSTFIYQNICMNAFLGLENTFSWTEISNGQNIF